MTKSQWEYFASFRNRFREQCRIWVQMAEGWLAALQTEAVEADQNPYPLETPIVYNRTLDEVNIDDVIRLIVVGDNPGKNEQLARNQRYLVGQAGKLGESFFRGNPELGIDFRKNTIILNKTPIHSARTHQLAHLQKKGGTRFSLLFKETQIWMARETAMLQKNLGCELWLVGYGELGSKGLFSVYADELTRQYESEADFVRGCNAVKLYQHFSMNRFSIDLKQGYMKNLSLEDNLRALGFAHRNEILLW